MEKNEKKELIFASILCVIVAFIDVSSLPFSLISFPSIMDVTPVYWAIFSNFALSILLIIVFHHFLCRGFDVSLRKPLKDGFGLFSILAITMILMSLLAVCLGLANHYDYSPTALKVFIEVFLYNAVLAFVEEYYLRGLLLNILAKLFYRTKYSVILAILISSFLFGIGHIFGMNGLSPFVVCGRVAMVIGLGLVLGSGYKITDSLFVPIVIHFLINVTSMGYTYSTFKGYEDVTIWIFLFAFLILGFASLFFYYKVSLKRSSLKDKECLS